MPRAVHAATLDVSSLALSSTMMSCTVHSPTNKPRAALVYSSIYGLQSSTQRLPIRALFGFTLKLVESYSSLVSQSLACGGLSLVLYLGSPQSGNQCELDHCLPTITYNCQ